MFQLTYLSLIIPGSISVPCEWFTSVAANGFTYMTRNLDI